MVKHLVFWNFVEGVDKQEAYEKMKSLLEPIKASVPGAIDIQVVKNELASSNRDVALIPTMKPLD